MRKTMACRIGCGACCIAPSLSSSLPGMPAGKPAGTKCLHLTEAHRCGIYEQPGRPAVCGSYQASEEFCGASREDALRLLSALEALTCAVPKRRSEACEVILPIPGGNSLDKEE